MDLLPSRKRTRLIDYDYATPGAYFVTICTAERKPLLSTVVVGQGLAPAAVRLSAYGRIVQAQLAEIPQRFPNIQLDHFVIMPNHIHILMTVTDAPPHSSVIDAVRTLKSLTTRACRLHTPDHKLFQSSFYDHIIRGKEDYDAIWTYIDNNPARWAMDRFYICE
ncbi:MAG: transposase [Clostridia bacterium]|nr:transposase [Clostridia bacterium]